MLRGSFDFVVFEGVVGVVWGERGREEGVEEVEEFRMKVKLR